MIIKTLVENTSLSDDFRFEHGLSFYIEVQNHKMLFDVGASDLFLENANKMGVDIADVDMFFLSHGHYDHGGGLKYFLDKNKKAKLFIHEKAFEPHYADHQKNKLDYIGLDETLKNNDRITFTKNGFNIDENLNILADVPQIKLSPKSNKSLFMEQNGQKINDTFIHEQNLVIKDNGKTILITGCAHNGIVNILEHFNSTNGFMPDIVIGGFHLSSRSGTCESNEDLDKIAEYLIRTNAKFYTCHCTGIEAYARLKNKMGRSVDYLSVSSQLTI